MRTRTRPPAAKFTLSRCAGSVVSAPDCGSSCSPLPALDDSDLVCAKLDNSGSFARSTPFGRNVPCEVMEGVAGGEKKHICAMRDGLSLHQTPSAFWLGLPSACMAFPAGLRTSDASSFGFLYFWAHSRSIFFPYLPFITRVHLSFTTLIVSFLFICHPFHLPTPVVCI